MLVGALAFAGVWSLMGHFGQGYSWPRSVFEGLVIGLICTIAMAVADKHRRRQGRSPLFPDGTYRENFRKGWAAQRYSPLQWLGFALFFGAFCALGLVLLVTGEPVFTGAVCTALFGVLTATCLTQAMRARSVH
jgi:drug/metabolite transporter (DMT)-like permease